MINADEKVLERIRNLLAMAKSNSPEEAAIAARRARALMDKYQVTELDLTSLDAVDFTTEEFATGRKRADALLNTLAIAASNLNDCVLELRADPVSKYQRYVFKGLLSDSVCAVEMYKYLVEVMERLTKENASGRAGKAAYRYGVVMGIRVKVNEILEERKDIMTSDNKSLVLHKMAMVEDHFGEGNYGTSAKRKVSDREAYAKGFRDGHAVNMSRQVQNDTKGYIE